MAQKAQLKDTDGRAVYPITSSALVGMSDGSGSLDTKLAQIEQLLQQEAEANGAYGIEFDTTISTPTCTRIGSPALHRTLPVQGAMRGCLLDDNGQVVKYLDPADWTAEARDGSQGQVMVELPEFYIKFTADGTKRRVMISPSPLSGYIRVPRQYVSAYEATIDRTDTATPKLASVANTAAEFRGGNNTADWDGTHRSLLGMPATATSRTNFRLYARNRNAAATAEWNCYLYEAHKWIYWLFAVEYATLNSQAAYNAEPTAEGYRQGGLGSGVTTINGTKWNAWNGYNPFIPCGSTDALGNGSGEVEFTMPDEYDTGVATVVKIPRYRGIENPFGHLWKWSDGLNVRNNPTAENGGNDLSEVFVCTDPAKFVDNGYDGYSHVGNEARNEGYVKEVIFGERGEIMPLVCSGAGSTTYHCDYHYTNIPTTVTLRGVLFGGNAINGAYAGFASAYSHNAPSNSYAHFGSRLCFIPA